MFTAATYPPRSVLGPLLFLLYINDLPNVSNELSFHLFADDTNIFFEASNLDTLHTTGNREMGKVVNWLDSNRLFSMHFCPRTMTTHAESIRLALNVSKTNFVIFSTKNKPVKPVTIIINRQAIEQKGLGILIDSKLSFKRQITFITKKISRAIGLLYKLRHYVSKKVLIMMYESLIYPFFDICFTSICDS